MQSPLSLLGTMVDFAWQRWITPSNSSSLSDGMLRMSALRLKESPSLAPRRRHIFIKATFVVEVYLCMSKKGQKSAFMNPIYVLRIRG